MYVLFAAAVLSLLSLSAASPLHCQDLVQPLVLDDLTRILGKWIFLEGAADHPRHAKVLKSVNSSWMNIVPTLRNDTIIFMHGRKINGTCRHSTQNMTISDLTTIHVSHSNGTANITFLPTCPDCLLMRISNLNQGTVIRTLYIYGRERKLRTSDWEMYRRQAECLGLPRPHFTYDGQKDLCPEEKKISDMEESKDKSP
ncbi:alpha-1-acid glycoprotein 1-like [Megalops cyprinoides]|uniref:alpha-1-acid glycoprotein 1-like n=1 Tax=Megalops cyprinoides TaxID=118141 RepID=UPI001864837A|nr:alpha-1-acid glycoprotein 1-like [Megalops cyprinoides]